MKKEEFLIRNNYIEINSNKKLKNTTKDIVSIGTLLANLSYYGYTVNKEGLDLLMLMNKEDLINWWSKTENGLKVVTGSDRKMEKYMVYKNFPKEVLDMSEAEYWFKQILMYLGVDKNYLTQEELPRKEMNDKITPKVLSLSDENTNEIIWESLKKVNTSWSDIQNESIKFLLRDKFLINEFIKKETKEKIVLDVKEFAFKENIINLVGKNMSNFKLQTNAATDVIRLAYVMSDGLADMKEKIKFKKFNRKERKELLEILDNCSNLDDDFSRNPEGWKRLLNQLHPGDYKFNNINKAYDNLYKNKLDTFNSKVEEGIKNKNKDVLSLLEIRPGEFLRRFHKTYELFGNEAVQSFNKVLNELNTIQLLKFEKYIDNINTKKINLYPPKGNWSKLKTKENSKFILLEDLKELKDSISFVINKRLNTICPNGVDLDNKLEAIKIQNNSQKLSNYGQGTSFDIPKETKVIRTATYWDANQNDSNIWIDNGWLFEDKNNNVVATCWNSTSEYGVFSGDPLSSKSNGKSCQVIDLDLEKMKKNGVKYAVWNVLSFNSLDFDQLKDILVTLQFAEEGQSGKMYEPSRAQLVFQLKDKVKAKYVAMVDVQNNKLIYLDFNLSAKVSSAYDNKGKISEQIKQMKEHINSLPSIYDLFKHAEKNENGMKVLFSDKDIEINDKAYVFKNENPNNIIDKIDINEILNNKSIEKNKNTIKKI